MKKSLLICGFILLAGFSTACVAKEAMSPVAQGDSVISYLTEANPYQQWQLWPGTSKLYPGKQPHGAFLTTYVSKGAYAAIKSKRGTIPDNGMIVKENYSPAKKLAAITLMYKKAGYNPDGGDWFWMKYAPDGKIMKEGKVGGCINCHASVKANDWLFNGPL